MAEIELDQKALEADTVKARAAAVICDVGALCGWPGPDCKSREAAEALYEAGLLTATRPVPDEDVCPDCQRHIFHPGRVAEGWLAACGRRLSRREECGAIPRCEHDEHGETIFPARHVSDEAVEAVTVKMVDAAIAALWHEITVHPGGSIENLDIGMRDALCAALAHTGKPTVKPLECATEGCNHSATVYFERGDVGSHYCHNCYLRVQSLQTGGETS